jgi:hypothetical protein
MPAAADNGSAAAPSAAPPATAAAKPVTRCTVTDARLPEISGLVVVGDKMLAMNDGGDRVSVYLLDSACRVATVHTAGVDPYDPEDLAVGRDGTVWLADTGDNRTDRPTVALIAVRPNGTTGVYRLTYPDGPHDAEALLLTPDGTPYIVTKEVLGASGVYRPLAKLVSGGTVGLGKVSTVNVTLTGTPGGPVGRAGQLMITGGAIAADGSRLALRTYTDAYVWPMSGSDVVAALSAHPIRIPLPASPQGEAISFSADGKQLVVASEGLPSAVTVVPVPAPPASTSSTAGPVAGAPASLTDFTRSGLSPITSGAIAAVAAALIVWIGSKFSRRS